MPTRGSKAKRMTCPYCGVTTSYLMRHIRKYHPEKDDIEQVILDMYGKPERDRCLNPNCRKKIVHRRLDVLPEFCNNKCQNEYYRLTGNHEKGLIRVSKDSYDKPSALYVVMCEPLHILKIGVSNNPDVRRANLWKAIQQPLDTYFERWSTTYQCHMWERELSAKYVTHKVTPEFKQHQRWAGSSEWFSDEILEDLTKDLNELKEVSSTTIP